MKKVSKRLVIILLTVIISTFLINVVYAESSKMLQAWFGVKIMYNNQQLVSNTDPFIVDGTTYVPLRLLMNSFDKNITWDGTNNTVNIYDKPSTTEISLRNQIIAKDATIAQLEAKIKKLEEDGDSDSTSLSDLEDDLNDDYADYNSKDFEISLDGDEDEIEVVIETSSSDWSALSSSNKTSLLKNICDDIRDKYDDAEISGYVKTSSSSKPAYFRYTSADTLSMNTVKEIIDLEKSLDKDYNDYFESKDIPLYITLTGTKSSPTFNINVDYHKYESKWDALSDSQIKTLMSNIFDDIQDEFEADDEDIEGYVYDTYGKDEIASYSKSSSGTASFDRD